MKIIFKLLILCLFSTNVYAMFEATSVPAPKTAPPLYPRFIGSRVALNTALPVPGTVGKQRIACLWQMAKKVDPIVQYGVFPSNHLHDIIGNPTLDEWSTTESLQLPIAGSSCAGGSEYQSAAWWPSIVDTANGNKYKGFSQAIIYYSSTWSKEKVQPIPQGLKMVIGSMSNTEPAKNLSEWNCASMTAPYTARIASSPTIPTCYAGERLRETLRFNQCLKLKADGTPYLDTDNSAAFTANDHKQHVVKVHTGNWAINPANNSCPTGYMLIPEVLLIRDYPVYVGNTAGYRVVTDNSDMSNPGGTAHADYFAGLKQKWQDMIVTNCIRTGMDCGMGKMGIDPEDGISKIFIQ